MTASERVAKEARLVRQLRRKIGAMEYEEGETFEQVSDELRRAKRRQMDAERELRLGRGR